MITQEEYKVFYNLFVLPFNRCDKDEIYYIDLEDLNNCFGNKTKMHQAINNSWNQTILLIQRSRDFWGVNFQQYVFLRKISYIWENFSEDGKFI